MERPLRKATVSRRTAPGRVFVFLASVFFLSLGLATGKLPAQILVNDFVAGGDGTGTALDGVVGINADTGLFEFAHQNDTITNTGDNPQPVDDIDTPFLNSVFIIDQPSMAITTTNVLFDFQAGDATGDTWNHIIKDVTHDIDKGIEDIWAGGVDTWTSAIGIHASAGVTFELEEIRAEFGDDVVNFFSAFAGSDQCGGMEINLYVILSGEEEVLDSVSVGPITNNQGEPIQIEIPDEALYLTLATGASNNSISCAHGVFADPVITAFPTFPPLREVTSPGDAAACPPTGGGPITVTLSQEQAEDVDLTEPITVTERVRGPITAADVTAEDATIDEVFPTGFTEQGFINTWLLLGPFSRTGGPAPGIDAIRLDYLTDGVDVDEITVEPRAGDTVDTDFGGVAASTGLAATPAAINPGGVPTWTRHVDSDDTINFNDYYGGDVNDNMMYGVVYVTLEEPLDLDIGIGSDDSIQVLVDGEEVLLHNGGRGFGGANTIQNTALEFGPVPVLTPLEAGTHTIMVKVFEGVGGHGFRLRFQDPFTFEPVTEGISVCLDPEQDPCEFAPIGVDLAWETTLGDLADGLEYSVDLDVGTVSFGGEAGDEVIAGDGSFTLIVPPEDFGPIAGFEHAHRIGAPCAGTGVTEPDPGVIEIAGAGVDIWQGGDQFMFAYSEVTGDFRADVRVVDRQPAVGSRWGKHGIMARQDCSLRSRYSYTHDATGDVFTDPDNNDDSTRHATRPTHGGSDNFELTPLPTNPTDPDVDDFCDGVGPDDGTCTVEHHDWLRLERFGNVFSSFSRQTADDPWVFLGSHDWGDDAPDTVQVGLAVTSHEGCEVATIQFDSWELTPGTPPQRPLNLACTGSAAGFDLSWENVGAGAGPLTISVNGAELETLPEGSDTATVPEDALLPGANTIAVTNDSGSSTCTVSSGEVFINAGGPRLDDALGTGLGDDRVWEEDTSANPSPFLASPNANTADFAAGAIPAFLTADTTLTEPDFIDDPLQSMLFATERWDTQDIMYRIPVPQGSYSVQLLFAEGCCSGGCEDIADPEQSAGDCRVFDILVNGELVEDQFAQHVVAQRGLGNALPNNMWGVAVATGPYEVRNTNLVEVVVDDLGAGNPPENASIKGIAITPSEAPPPEGFVRGDIDGDGRLNITDAIVFLGWRFLGDPPPPCLDAADVDDRGDHNITDAIFLLQFQFLGTAPPPLPGPTPGQPLTPANCGTDPTADDFGCAEPPALCGG